MSLQYFVITYYGIKIKFFSTDTKCTQNFIFIKQDYKYIYQIRDNNYSLRVYNHSIMPQ